MNRVAEERWRSYAMTLHANACPLCQADRACDTGSGLERRWREVAGVNTEPQPNS